MIAVLSLPHFWTALVPATRTRLANRAEGPEPTITRAHRAHGIGFTFGANHLNKTNSRLTGAGARKSACASKRTEGNKLNTNMGWFG